MTYVFGQPCIVSNKLFTYTLIPRNKRLHIQFIEGMGMYDNFSPLVGVFSRTTVDDRNLQCTQSVQVCSVRSSFQSVTYHRISNFVDKQTIWALCF